ncbi:MAG: hypothetical protein CXT66_03810 [Methanobacteriota archaeon]|jgi:hypothetical protein|nr:MAG: hypothetical protein CXT66_03810 [Euryarchaeota archaeon]
MPGDIFPTRGEIEWIMTDSENIEIIVDKGLRGIEKKVANLLSAPTVVRRPLDEMNSKLWILMDGTRTLGQIIFEMDYFFDEKIAPASERVSRSIAKFVELGFITLNRERFENESE